MKYQTFRDFFQLCTCFFVVCFLFKTFKPQHKDILPLSLSLFFLKQSYFFGFNIFSYKTNTTLKSYNNIKIKVRHIHQTFRPVLLPLSPRAFSPLSLSLSLDRPHWLAVSPLCLVSLLHSDWWDCPGGVGFWTQSGVGHFHPAVAESTVHSHVQLHLLQLRLKQLCGIFRYLCGGYCWL